MKSLFEIQTESGQLWVDISGQINAAQDAATKQVNDAKAELDEANKQVANLTQQLTDGAAILSEHQKISDDLANRAAKAMVEGDIAALPAIIADAKTFGDAREKKKLLEEAAALKKQSADLAERAKEITAKAEAL